jgi:predicted O-methyltransferase YrrM
VISNWTGRPVFFGCGHGVSTLLMATAFPNSTFYGFDYHDGSIQSARDLTREAGLSDRVHFDVHSAKTFRRTDTTWCASLIACTIWVTPSAP